MSNKITIELRPYDALAIYCFMSEFVNDDNKHLSEMAAIHESLDNYKVELFKKISSDQLDDAVLENQINFITGRNPPKANNDTDVEM